MIEIITRFGFFVGSSKWYTLQGYDYRDPNHVTDVIALSDLLSGNPEVVQLIQSASTL